MNIEGFCDVFVKNKAARESRRTVLCITRLPAKTWVRLGH